MSRARSCDELTEATIPDITKGACRITVHGRLRGGRKSAVALPKLRTSQQNDHAPCRPVSQGPRSESRTWDCFRQLFFRIDPDCTFGPSHSFCSGSHRGPSASPLSTPGLCSLPRIEHEDATGRCHWLIRPHGSEKGNSPAWSHGQCCDEWEMMGFKPGIVDKLFTQNAIRILNLESAVAKAKAAGEALRSRQP